MTHLPPPRSIRHRVLVWAAAGFAALAAHGGAGDVRVKLDDRQHQGYFDPHAHWPGGILPWKAYLPMVTPPEGADPVAFRRRAEELVRKPAVQLT